jgi:hypothetical protein
MAWLARKYTQLFSSFGSDNHTSASVRILDSKIEALDCHNDDDADPKEERSTIAAT